MQSENTAKDKILKIAVFETDFSKLTSVGISLATKASFTHAAFYVDGHWYDTSESRGYFSEIDPKEFINRNCIVLEYEMNDEEYERAKSTTTNLANMPYNYEGLIMYFFSSFIKKQHELKMYCFQACWYVFWFILHNESFIPERVSANYLLALMFEYDVELKYKKGIL